MSLRTTYQTKTVPHLKEILGLSNLWAVPKVEKVVINAGIGRTLKDAKLLDQIVEDFKKITGQSPVKTKAKKSIAGFKIRENQIVGLVVTLRGKRMYDFLEKLIRVALPRVRDFKGLNPKSFDGRGNYSIGIKEQNVFPETTGEGVQQSFGFEVNIQTKAKDNKQAFELLKAMGFPFAKD